MTYYLSSSQDNMDGADKIEEGKLDGISQNIPSKTGKSEVTEILQC